MTRFTRNGVLIFASVVSAIVLGPSHVAKRFDPKSADISTVGATDISILQYALTLEHLEATYYAEAIANFTEQQFADAGFDATFYSNLQSVAKDEAAHVSFISDVLQKAGAAVPQKCIYRFPYSDPASFVALSAVLEGVGVSAYSGAASSVKTGDVLTAAASVLAIEARHASYVRLSAGLRPFPAAFDVPLDFNQIYTLALPFFVTCPAGNPPLALNAFPQLSLVNSTGPLTPGKIIHLSTSNVVLAGPDGNTEHPLYAAFLSVTGPIFATTTKITSNTYAVTIPEGISGQSYVLLSSCNERVNDGTTAAGPAILEVVGA